MTISIKSVNFFVMCASLVKAKILQKHPFEGFFLFCSKWSPFSKMLVFNGDIKFS